MSKRIDAARSRFSITPFMSEIPAKPATGIHGVMVVRNEWDVIAFNLLHHLRLGLDRIHVVDNGSTDGTEALLETMSRMGPVSVTRHDGPFEQKRITNELAQTALAQGAKWIVPIDADEFWDPGSRKLATIFRRCKDEEPGQRVAVQNYFVPMSERSPRLSCALHARWVTVETLEQSKTNREDARDGRIPVSLLEPLHKCFFRADRGLLIEQGGHRWEGMSRKSKFAADLIIHHLPHRHQQKTEERRKAGERILASPDYVLGNSWHLTRLVSMNAMQLASEWMASSVHRGELRHGDRRFAMREDDSLYRLLHPLRKAAKKIHREAGVSPRLRWFGTRW
ncbi:MAG: glycosyltransferase family 2 protein [Chthoniobacterales bacterium]